MKKILFASVLASIALCSWVEGEITKPLDPKAADAAKAEAEKIPVRMTALSARYEQKNGIATFTDAVKVDDGKIRLECDKMTAYFVVTPDKKDAAGLTTAPKTGAKSDKTSIPAEKKDSSFTDTFNNKIDHIVCEKNVVIRKDDQVATSERAEYFYAEEKVVLTGNPVLTSKTGVLKAARIIFYRNSEIVEFSNLIVDQSVIPDAKGLSTP